MIPEHFTFQGLAFTSFLVSMIIVIFLPLRPLLRRVFGSRGVSLLWVMILVRLLLPFPLESHWSLVGHEQTSREHFQIPAMSLESSASGKAVTKNIPDQNTSIVVAAGEQQEYFGPILNIVWISGFIFSLGMLAWRWDRTRRLAATTRPPTDERLVKIFHSFPAELRRDVELRMTDTLQMATLAGVFRPQIWFPEAWLLRFTDEELRDILLHELGHARRHDLLVQWLFALAQCLHWFNPIMWLANRAACFDREMACDAWVLARADGGDASQYGATLMKTAQLLNNGFISHTVVAMASSRRNLRERISGISTFHPASAWRVILGAAIMLATLGAITTTRITGAEPPASRAKGVKAAPASISSPSLSPASSAEPIIVVHARLAEMPADTKLPRDIEEMFASNGKGKWKRVDMLSAPVVKVRAGQPAIISIERSFDVENKGKFSVGVKLSIKPILKADGVAYSGECEITEFMGFAEHATTKSPVLSTDKVVFDGSAEMRKTVWLSCPRPVGKQIVKETGKPEKIQYFERKLVITLSFEKG